MEYYIKHSNPKYPRPWKKMLLLLAAVSLTLYLVFMAGYYATSFPRFCAACHEVRPYVVSWENSPHKDVNCLYCHEFRGFLGKLDSKQRGLNYLYQHLTGQYTVPFKAEIFEQNCAGCHLGDYRDYPKAVRMGQKHYDYMQADRSCLDCHRATGHRVNLFTREKFGRNRDTKT